MSQPSEDITSPRVDPDDDTGQRLPPPPKPTSEPQAPPPGGPHAIEGVGGDGAYTREPHDPDPLLNPATDDLPPETTTGEDTDTEATRGNADVAPEEESPA
ncbi:MULTISPECIES: hypothetical protein [unclassified Nocardioides]|uniref:hypothetical protein n=1 Tax=unclassified Nocardioides TaxID=2615069 RepID=UPI000703A987|nr:MULTISPECIES: hypothetical protein [unclassified Nocardioides]KRC59657.1 hypothetical protein ASE19_01125 [Nocardioides sp. Root79]KRC68518.1 hypothetical protein ASE20_16835 [Nocardioides sp. Root240]